MIAWFKSKPGSTLKITIAKIFLVTYSLFASFDAGADDTVRVLLGEENQSLEFSTKYPVHFESGSQKMNLNHPKMKFKITHRAGLWRVDVPGQPTYSMKGARLDISSISIIWNSGNVVYPISIFFKNGRYQLVGHMNIEDYLKGVLPHEMPSSWPLEALKAQAVASRSYALWKKKHQENSHYDLRTSVLDQMFRLNKVGESSSAPPRVEEALRATRGIALLDKSTKVLKAYFHSDCGGATDGPGNVWGTDSHQGSIRDVACARRSSGWESQWSKEKIEQKIQSEIVIPGNADLKDLIVRSHLQSERAQWVDLLFSNGYLKRVRGEDIRRILGYDKIKSTLFAVQKANGKFIFKGRGFGHGVGLCQHGARAMAQAGETYQNILNHYYPTAVLRSPLPPVELKEATRAVSSL
jgi:SpoIID/LytB domain protein